MWRNPRIQLGALIVVIVGALVLEIIFWGFDWWTAVIGGAAGLAGFSQELARRKSGGRH